MSDFIITTDTTSDLPESYIKDHNIEIHPLYYNLDGVIYGGDIKLPPEEFYIKMRAGQMPTTMAVNPETSKDIFRKYLDQGLDILHIGFSSALSGSFNSAMIAANELKEMYPDRKIILIDSLSASLGEGLLVHKAVMLKESGKSLEETASWIEENKLHLCHLFTVSDLFHLQRGGRVSKATAIIGTMINVKPILHVDNEGKLIPLQNVRGRKRSLTTLVDTMEKQIKGYEKQNDIIFISHGDSLEDAQYLASLIKSRFGIQSFLIDYVCPTIGSHSGPGTIALFFMGAER